MFVRTVLPWPLQDVGGRGSASVGTTRCLTACRSWRPGGWVLRFQKSYKNTIKCTRERDVTHEFVDAHEHKSQDARMAIGMPARSQMPPAHPRTHYPLIALRLSRISALELRASLQRSKRDESDQAHWVGAQRPWVELAVSYCAARTHRLTLLFAHWSGT